jgi:hypothetical protein
MARLSLVAPTPPPCPTGVSPDDGGFVVSGTNEDPISCQDSWRRANLPNLEVTRGLEEGPMAEVASDPMSHWL